VRTVKVRKHARRCTGSCVWRDGERHENESRVRVVQWCLACGAKRHKRTSKATGKVTFVEVII
jgi:hypothetical protein